MRAVPPAASMASPSPNAASPWLSKAATSRGASAANTTQSTSPRAKAASRAGRPGSKVGRERRDAGLRHFRLPVRCGDGSVTQIRGGLRGRGRQGSRRPKPQAAAERWEQPPRLSFDRPRPRAAVPRPRQRRADADFSRLGPSGTPAPRRPRASGVAGGGAGEAGLEGAGVRRRAVRGWSSARSEPPPPAPRPPPAQARTPAQGRWAGVAATASSTASSRSSAPAVAAKSCGTASGAGIRRSAKNVDDRLQAIVEETHPRIGRDGHSRHHAAVAIRHSGDGTDTGQPARVDLAKVGLRGAVEDQAKHRPVAFGAIGDGLGPIEHDAAKAAVLCRRERRAAGPTEPGPTEPGRPRSTAGRRRPPAPPPRPTAPCRLRPRPAKSGEGRGRGHCRTGAVPRPSGPPSSAPAAGPRPRSRCGRHRRTAAAPRCRPAHRSARPRR